MASMITATQAETDVTTAKTRLAEAIAVKEAMLHDVVLQQAVEVAHVVVAALRAGNKAIFFGNGGSSMDAGHLAAELTGRFAYDRPGLAAVSLSDSTAAVTAIANDYSYSDVFARQVLGVGRPGDVVFGLSTSGTSPNVVKGLEIARAAGMVTVALTGADGGHCLRAADYCVRVPSSNTPRVQEACLHIGHTICELIEAAMFPRSR